MNLSSQDTKKAKDLDGISDPLTLQELPGRLESAHKEHAPYLNTPYFRSLVHFPLLSNGQSIIL